MLDRKSIGLFVAGLLMTCAATVSAQLVPGSGVELTELNDNFEDANWSFNLNLPKASTNIDKIDRQPAGYSTNGMWFESTYRGTPDFVKRVETPPGGIPGSTGAMAMQTKYSGVPGVLSNKFQQDDLIANVSQKLGYMIPAAWTPSYVVRVYLPPFESWEQRNGSSFGFRADCQTVIDKPTRMGRFFRTGGTSKEMEQYWPGFFIQFNAKNHPQYLTQNTATILIRSGERGQDIPGPTITQPGWWTLGMTITPDGKVHYYGHAGVANLTHRDHLYSNFPYGYKCLHTSTYFFNIVNQDDGQTWSTRWIVDDPKVYVASRPYTPQTAQAQVPAQPISQTRPVPPASPPAAVPATTPVTTQPTIAPPTAAVVPAPIVPKPAIQPPAVQQPTAPVNPPPIPAAPPATTLVPETKSAIGGLPALQASVMPIAPLVPPKTNPGPIARAKAPTALSFSATVSTTTLPPLLNVPIPVAPIPITPTKAAGAVPPDSPPALLPEETSSDSAPLIAPVISAPAPAPMALPQDDAPMLPMTPPTSAVEATVPPLLPPAPPTAE